MYNSLRSRILLLVGFAVAITAASIFFFAQREMESAISSAEEQHASDLLHAVELSVETEYESLLFHKTSTLDRRKAELKNIVKLSVFHLQQEYQRYQNGAISLQEAQAKSIKAIESLRYDDGVGYIWINDTRRPIPRMIMHPTLPHLNGQLLDDPMFNTAMGSDTNLFVAALEKAVQDGSGFIDYLWPKPTKQGLTEQQPKISYVELFEPWGWVLGTGVYIDDIEAETQRRLSAIIKELNRIFAKVRIGDTGYMFMFNSKGKMLIHPNIKGEEFASQKNPQTQVPLYQDFIKAAKAKKQSFDYIWDKPGAEKEYCFPKRAFLTYFEPLDWYIGASMYIEELAEPGRQLQQRILYLALISLLVTFLIALTLSRSISTPLQKLAQSARKIGEGGLNAADIPISGTTETRELGHVLEQMVASLGKAENKRLNLEKQILHVQKLESLGVLAGGIAHDFNNILLAITGNADMGLRRLSKNDSPEPHLQRIKHAAEKAADLARQMLAYSGKGKFLIEPLDINQLLNDMLHILEVSISKKAKLNLNLADHLPPIEADATQIRQIVLNLIVNASEALDDKDGEISIGTSRQFCTKTDFKCSWQNEMADQAEYVCLEVSDSGCGMDRQTIEKLFDPFFTTKFTGRGLGMSAVQGIVRGHKGAITVTSEPSQGTTFKVYLPSSEKPTTAAHPSADTETWQGKGNVLLVDDEETVRSIGSEMLAELGFTVVTANDGEEALHVYRQNPEFEFVILDLTMPLMSGEECFRKLKIINPEIKVIFSSGYSESDVIQPLVQEGLCGFIQKPYWLDTLREAIRKTHQA